MRSEMASPNSNHFRDGTFGTFRRVVLDCVSARGRSRAQGGHDRDKHHSGRL